MGLSGSVKLDSPYFDGQSIDPDELFRANDDSLVFGTKTMTKKQIYDEDITLARVRNAFQKDAEMIIFACHSGINEKFTAQIAKLLGVKVRGFKKEIKYTIYTDDRHQKITRRSYGFEGEKQEYSNFRDMIKFATP